MTEDQGERLDRELIELLNELRVVLPGVQVLLAFLLTAPFNQRFVELGPGERAGYLTALLSTTVATALLIAPTTFHRLRWRERDKAYLLRLSNGLVVLGTAFVAVGIASALFVVISMLHGGWVSWAATVGTVVLLVGLWYGLPLARRTRRP